MKQYAFYVNTDKCISCKTCVIACKEKHNHIPGRKFRRVYTNAVGSWVESSNGVLKPQNVFSYSLSVACNHCADPACKKVCPANAIVKRDDGIVFIDKDACIGCKSCANACPYNAPSYNAEAEKMEKCDFCRELLAVGESPACVGACNMFCISYGELEQLELLHPEAVKQVEPLADPAQTRPSLFITPHRKSVEGVHITQSNMPEELQATET
jgi:anaerobic dimethyl sulfoxide reductase subunit B (iron-sulfur subunit)